MQKILKTPHYEKRMCNSNDACLSCCKPSVREKDEIKHVIEGTNNANNKDYEISNQHQNEAPNEINDDQDDDDKTPLNTKYKHHSQGVRDS